MRWWVIVGVVVALGVGVHYATDSNARFCITHSCIGDFGSGNGSIVECSDGTWSHSGGVQGACSYHGGVGAASYAPSASDNGGAASDYATGSIAAALATARVTTPARPPSRRTRRRS